MIGSPNFGNFIYEGDGSDFDLAGPPGSAATEALFEKYFNLREIAAAEEAEPAAGARALQVEQQRDITHWGDKWIK